MQIKNYCGRAACEFSFRFPIVNAEGNNFWDSEGQEPKDPPFSEEQTKPNRYLKGKLRISRTKTKK